MPYQRSLSLCDTTGTPETYVTSQYENQNKHPAYLNLVSANKNVCWNQCIFN